MRSCRCCCEVSARSLLPVERQPAGVAAGEDRHPLGLLVGGAELRDQGVARLVPGDHLELAVADAAVGALGPGDRAHHPLVEVGREDGVAAGARGHDGRLVDHVGEVGAGEPGGDRRERLERLVAVDRHALRVQPQDRQAARLGGEAHLHPPVEAAGPQQRGVEHVQAVGGRDDHDPLALAEAVELHQQLVEGALALGVGAAHARAAGAADGVDLVEEDDRAGLAATGLGEEVAHPGGADADVGVDEVRAREGEEGHARLARDGLGEQGLAGARRAVQGDAARHARAHAAEALRLLEEDDHLAQLLDRLVAAGDVGEAGRRGRDLGGAADAAVAAGGRAPTGSDAAATPVAPPDEQHAAHDEQRHQGEAQRQQQRPHRPAQARARPRRGGSRAQDGDAVAAQVRGQVEGARQAPAAPAFPATAPGVVAWAKSRPGWGFGICAAMTLPPRSMAATQ